MASKARIVGLAALALFALADASQVVRSRPRRRMDLVLRRFIAMCFLFCRNVVRAVIGWERLRPCRW